MSIPASVRVEDLHIFLQSQDLLGVANQHFHNRYPWSFGQVSKTKNTVLPKSYMLLIKCRYFSV